MNNKPADGERSAASGYRAQYLVGASIVLNALEGRDLEWIKVADPNIGRVDDLQVATTVCVDAYQVKWEQYAGAITLNDLTQSKKSAPPLFAQLADGWKKLKEQNPHHRAVVHLVTNQYASTSKSASMPATTSKPEPYHFAAFLEQAWIPAQRKGKVEISGAWNPVWKAIQDVTDLPAEDFICFVLDCSLNFKTNLPQELDDIKAISDLLFSTAASPERQIKLSRSELIRTLGWRQRYSTWNVHEFPGPKLYCPIKNTVENLKTAINNLQGGYIGVFGSPGSGKSTLLTQTLRALPIRLIRYYAFVPDSQDPSAVRGESISFLHDVTLKLSNAGVKVNDVKDSTDRIGLLSQFKEQLQALGTDYQNSGEKTVFLVDGLDHITREQHPERSMLHDLPLPQEIPDGVIFVLGSQTDELSELPPKVLQELSEENRRVEMGKFTPTDTRALAVAAIPDLCEEEYKKIFEQSDGHPLALIYLLKEIEQIPDADERKKYLGESQPFEGDIEKQYWSHWYALEDDEELQHVLGLLCRTRGAIPMDWVASWAEAHVLRKIKKLFPTYFEKDSQDRWYFFHNSFRLFLITRTSEPLPGRTEEQQNQSYYLELASRYKEADTPWRWETLYHYFFAGDHKSVAELATWDWFLQQAAGLRPLDAIQTDIRLALKSTGKRKDTLLLARLTLIGAAIQQRSRALEDYPIPDVLLEAGEPGLAADHIRDGNRLRVGIELALKVSGNLFESGLEREAQRVFELAEPHELLSGRTIEDNHTRPQDLWEILQSWARSAILFRSAEEIVETIRRIRVAPRWSNESDTEADSRELQNWLVFQSSLACSEWNDWDSWKTLYAAFEGKNDQTMRLFTLLRATEYVERYKIENRIQELLPELISDYPPSYFEEIESDHWILEGRISLAELLSKRDDYQHLAIAYIQRLKPIPIYDSDLGYDEKPLQQNIRFRLTRLRYELGESRSPDQILEDSESNTNYLQHTEEERKKAYRYIALATITAAKLWGMGKSGQKLSPLTFIQETKWIIDLFGQGWSELSVKARIYSSGSRYNVLSCVIFAAIQHDNEVLHAVKEELNTRWLDLETREKWHPGLKRKIVNTLVRTGIDPNWAHDQLRTISSSMFDGLDPYGRAEECKAQAEAWLLINDQDQAVRELKRMVDAARGIQSEKDYQLSAWVEWLARINQLELGMQQERIKLMLRRLASVNGVASGVTSAAEQLLNVAFSWSPQRAAMLLKAMLEADLVGFDDGVNQLLRAALTANDPPCEEVKQTVLNLVLPFCKKSEPLLLKELIISIAEHSGKNTAKETAQRLIKRIGIVALRDTRFKWAQGVLEGLEAAGLSHEDVVIGPSIKDSEGQTGASQLDRQLYLKDGETISLLKAKTLVKTIDDLARLLENEDTEKTQYFEWADLVEHLASLLIRQEDLGSLLSLLLPKYSTGFSKEINLGRLHISLSKGYEKINNRNMAWKHAKEALEHSSPSGWDPYWDGGVRINALKQLKSIDPGKTNEFIFDLYASDLGERAYYPTTYMLHLHEILELLSDKLPVSEIWREIEKYMADLFVSVEIKEVNDLEMVINDAVDLREEDNAHSAIAKLLLIFLTFPSYTIAQGAVRTLTNLLLTGKISALEVIAQAMASGNDLFIERTLMALVALRKSEGHTDTPDDLREALNNLCVSQNFAIRLFASMALEQRWDCLQRIGNKATQLPPIYQLHLPDMSFHETWQSANGGQKPILVGDLARKLRPLDEELRVIAKISNLPENNIFYRAKKLFDTFMVFPVWLNTGEPVTEKRLSAFLNNVGVWTSYTKPHIFAARQALAYVIAELWDSDYLSIDDIGTIKTMLINFDPMFIIQEPSARPSFITEIGSQSEKQYDLFPENWVNIAKESLPFMQITTTDDLFILGETTRLKFLQDDWPSEVRHSVVKGIPEEDFWVDTEINNGHPPFLRNINILAEQYSGIQEPAEQFVIVNETYGYETPGSDWLALNPSLGRELGWILDPGGLFQWMDDQGNVLVRSIWWRDGSIELYNRFARQEVAEGWLVLISRAGLEDIMNQFPIINRGCLVRRSTGWLGNKDTHVAKQLAPLEVGS